MSELRKLEVEWKCPECGAGICKHATDALNGHARHAEEAESNASRWRGMYEESEQMRGTALLAMDAAESRADALQAEVRRADSERVQALLAKDRAINRANKASARADALQAEVERTRMELRNVEEILNVERVEATETLTKTRNSLLVELNATAARADALQAEVDRLRGLYNGEVEMSRKALRFEAEATARDRARRALHRPTPSQERPADCTCEVHHPDDLAVADMWCKCCHAAPHALCTHPKPSQERP